MLTYELPSVTAFICLSLAISTSFTEQFSKLSSLSCSRTASNKTESQIGELRVGFLYILFKTVLQKCRFHGGLSRPHPSATYEFPKSSCPRERVCHGPTQRDFPFSPRKSRRTFLRVLLRQRIYQLYEELLIFYFPYTITTFL